MRRGSLSATIVGVAVFAVSGWSSARAADPLMGWTPSVQAGVASDDLFRGIDQTRGRGEAFLTVQADAASARLGAFTSNVVVPGVHGGSTQAQGDLYGGWLTSVEGFDLETGAIGYLFSGARSRPDLLELYARLGRTFGPARITAATYYGAIGEHAAHDGYAELKVDYPITPKWSVFGAVGHLYENRPGVLVASANAAVQHRLDATSWNGGLSYSVTERVHLEVCWSDLDHRGPDDSARLWIVAKANLF